LCEHTEFLGFVVGQGKSHVAPSKIETILNFPRPKTQKGLRGFLGLVNWIRRHFPHLAQLKFFHLNEMLKKNAKIEWTPERIEALETLQVKSMEAPVISIPDFDHPYEIYTDASSRALGAMLVQRINDEVKIIAYASRVLQPAEKSMQLRN